MAETDEAAEDKDEDQDEAAGDDSDRATGSSGIDWRKKGYVTSVSFHTNRHQNHLAVERMGTV